MKESAVRVWGEDLGIFIDWVIVQMSLGLR